MIRIPVRPLALLACVCWGAVAAQQPGDALKLGLEAFNRKDFSKAEQLFRQAAAEQPGRALPYKLLGMTFAAREDYRQALAPFQRACALDPAEENACYYLGRTLYSLSRYEDARKAFDLALQSGHGRGRALLGLAQALEALGQTAAAERHYREAIAAGERRARVDYGLFLHRNGRGREAIEVLKDAGAPEELEKIRRSVAGAHLGAAPAPRP